jgi:photosystem II stability/assembly factor-like uncharacterized protein
MRIHVRARRGSWSARLKCASGRHSHARLLLLTLPFLLGLLIVPVVVAAPISTGDGGWIWQDPTPQGNSLSAEAFVGADHGWAVGTAGTIIATSDGGAHWTGQVSHTREWLKDVAFADADHGWAVGYSGTIIATKDGGASWRAQDSGTPEALIAVAFGDALHGSAADPNGDIFVTQDGGENWAKKASNMGLVNALFFADGSHGWAVGPFGNILATTDGGATWTRQNLDTGYSLNAVCFTDVAHGWAAGSAWIPGTSKYLPVLLTTSDGGAHWAQQSVPSGQNGLNLTAVSFVDVRHGWVAGDRDPVLVTSDGGQSWTSQAAAPTWLEDMTFVDSMHGWAVGGARVFSTADGGQSWTPQSAQRAGSLNGVSFDDPTHGCAVGADGYAYTTSDAGQSWTSDEIGNGDLKGVAYSDPAHIWAAGIGGIWSITSRAGVWGGGSVYGITFANAADGWAIGGSSGILATTDGGLTWEPQDPGTTHAVAAIDFVDAEHGWAVGGTGNIIVTSDGGQTWTPQTSGTSAYLRSVAFADAHYGWAVGDGGSIVSTTDGGATWTPRYPAASAGEGLYGVACTDADHAWAVGLVGTILATKDGGAHWTAQDSGTENNLTGVAFVDAEHGWVVGYGGTILATTTGGLGTVDETPPTTTATGVDDLWHPQPVTLSFAAVDNPGGSGMSGGAATTECKLDGGLWTSATSVTVPAPSDHSGDGLHTVRYRSCDAAGNCEAIRSVNVKVDTTAPTVSASGAAEGAWYRSVAPVTLTASDAASGAASITYVLDGASQAVQGTSVTIDVPVTPNAAHTLTFNATDAAANSCADRTVHFTIDTTGPVTAGRAASGRVAKAVDLRYAVTDNLSPLVYAPKVVVKNARGRVVWTYKTGASTARKNGTWYGVKWRPKAKGTYRYYVYAKDTAGNAQSRVGSAKVVVR